MKADHCWTLESNLARCTISLWHNDTAVFPHHRWTGLMARQLWSVCRGLFGLSEPSDSAMTELPSELSDEDSQRFTLRICTNQVKSLLARSMIERCRIENTLGIRRDLIGWNDSNHALAQELLFQIRSHDLHHGEHQLLEHVLNKGLPGNEDSALQALSELDRQGLIQQISTADGQVFYDRNTEPHAHLYYPSQNRLIDCSEHCRQLFRDKAELISPAERVNCQQ